MCLHFFPSRSPSRSREPPSCEDKIFIVDSIVENHNYFSALGKMTWWAFGCQIVWRLAMVASRIVALVLFASVYKSWILLVIGLHWLGMTVWILLQGTTFDHDNRILKFGFAVVIGFIYVFCFFNVKASFTRKRLVAFYVIMFAEVCVLMGAWLPYRHEYGVVFVISLCWVFGGFFLGVVALLLYYQCYHPGLPRQGICIRTDHDVPRVEGIVYKWICCDVCCIVRSYEDEESAAPRGKPLHIDIPASRGSLRLDVAREEEQSPRDTSSPRFEAELYFRKPSKLRKKQSMENDKYGQGKAKRLGGRHNMESGMGKMASSAADVGVNDRVPARNGISSQPSNLPEDEDEIQLQSVVQRNENGLVYRVDVHKPNEDGFSNGKMSRTNV